MEEENEAVRAANADCVARIKSGEVEGQGRDQIVGEWGREISEYEVKMSRMRREETNIVKREKQFERDNLDLIEYVKWISGDLSMLRDRARISEKVISDLKKSGEESVDSLMGTLSQNKQQQDALDREVDSIRAVIVAKEHEISLKEDEINNLKRLIELETNEKEIEIRRIKTEIEE
jgi:predicted  nucleic acid-binding Zn-ribbon protein